MRVERWRKTLKWEDSQLCRILSLRNELAEGCRIERNVYSGPAARRRQLQTSHHTQHIMKTGQLSACMPLRQPKQTNKQTNKFRGAGSASTNPNNRQPNADHKPAKGPTPAPEASNNEHVWPQDCPGLGSASSQQPLQLLSRFDGLTSARRQQPDDRVDQDGATEWNARN